MNPPLTTTPLSATFAFAHAATGTPDQRYVLHTPRIQERNNNVETITMVTGISSVLIAILALIFMGYKYWRKKRDPLPTTATDHACSCLRLPTMDTNDLFYFYLILMYLASAPRHNPRPASQTPPRPEFEIGRRSRARA
ncbi:uncharacterized protein LAJ45_04176 [Morchella importuna]|uniref:uncharacterized protein n=1 Tax=Morchella importuna TaxID=1174673 RepID=UPI001E8ED7F2|nr:uncharacterized protein LAJ45_04176 [Morchella importuna]KAH8151555.1 hypothetical protein LAJ45_04176 [Morchella importuna]